MIGFRVFEFPDKPIDEEKRREILKIKFLSYIAYLMVAIYLSNSYRDITQDNLGEQEFGEVDYKNIFEYKDEKDIIKRVQIDELVVLEREEERNRNQISTKFVKKSIYTENDLRDFYEHRRYFTPFIIYKWMDWWPLFDFLATYGHFLNGFIIVYLAINFTVSVFMLLNLISVCILYMVATYSLSSRAKKTS